ncbi:energy transducer TonB [Desulfobacula phenolica]|uniref:Protein TonB n=1 Tax=Desulfobacula phenolica TaxID=90732 RepID=A0A1H2IQP0_9BACT|nr:energy transducer TonB [Desulfobacula phenolica]SDU46449.1 protein TonB [Desulfobacula phenolica]
MTAQEQNTSNWLLRGFICLSMVIHFFIFLHMAGIYKNNAMSYIEFTMHEFSKPNIRHIPTPRMRQKNPDISKVQQIKTRKLIIPQFKMEKVQTHQMDNSYEKISMPGFTDTIKISDMTINSIADINAFQEPVKFTTAKEYFEMLNLRINSAKEYPEYAKSRHLEGRVTVEFVLQKDGVLNNIKVAKSSRHERLDNAAIEAVKRASPFPRPPSFLFKTPITLQVNIMFEMA